MGGISTLQKGFFHLLNICAGETLKLQIYTINKDKLVCNWAFNEAVSLHKVLSEV